MKGGSDKQHHCSECHRIYEMLLTATEDAEVTCPECGTYWRLKSPLPTTSEPTHPSQNPPPTLRSGGTTRSGDSS